MTTRMSLTDAEERFGLGVRRGFVPTAEPVSDTENTPFGLTLRTAPLPATSSSCAPEPVPRWRPKA